MTKFTMLIEFVEVKFAARDINHFSASWICFNQSFVLFGSTNFFMFEKHKYMSLLRHAEFYI